MARALVTGASAGVGAAFARLLSARGHEVVLTGRDRPRLEAVAAQLPGSTSVLVADLATADGLAAVEAVLHDRERPVDLLVANAAGGSHGPFAEQDPDDLAATVAVGATAVVRLAHAALTSMLPRDTGGIVVLSSLAGTSPQPGMAVYSATKAFVDSWATSVRAELRGSGVTLTCVRPGWVRTGFHARSGQDVSAVPDAEWLTADDVAARALDAHDRGRADVVVLPAVSPVRAVVRGTRRALARSTLLRTVLRRSS